MDGLLDCTKRDVVSLKVRLEQEGGLYDGDTISVNVVIVALGFREALVEVSQEVTRIVGIIFHDYSAKLQVTCASVEDIALVRFW